MVVGVVHDTVGRIPIVVRVFKAGKNAANLLVDLDRLLSNLGVKLLALGFKTFFISLLFSCLEYITGTFEHLLFPVRYL